MGDIVEMIMDGILCERCGCYMEDDLDFPHTCEDCQEEEQ